MEKYYAKYIPLIIGGLFLLLFAASCKKNKSDPTPAEPANFAKLGLYEQVGGVNRRLYIAISKVGTQAVNYGSVFDTGSTGMTIDANGVLPASMVSSSGITVTGDSVNVNGITVTSQQAIISYGGVGGQIQEYGNLGYATVTIGDGNGNITTPRIPIFIYYKIVNTTTNQTLAAHSNDVFGVGPGTSYASSKIASPLSYFKLAADVSSGFKLAMLPAASFLASPTYVAGLLTIGLTPKDLNSSGFIMHPLTYYASGGYAPLINSTISYNGLTINGLLLFDTGTPSTSIIENATATSNVSNLPANTTVSITTSGGFTYQYTTTADNNLTMVQKTSYSNDPRTIFSINFFINNEYLLDYSGHRIGLKNN